MKGLKLVAVAIGSFGIGTIVGSLITSICNKKRLIKYEKDIRKSLLDSASRVDGLFETVDQENDILKKTEGADGTIKNSSEPDESDDEVFESSSNAGDSSSSKIFNHRTEKEYIDYTKAYDSSSDDPNIEYIDPSNYGLEDTYDQIHLTVYEDGVVIDDSDDIVSTAKYQDTIGSDFMEHYGDYSDETVWIRNDTLKVYYEIDRIDECYYSGDGTHDYEGVD